MSDLKCPTCDGSMKIVPTKKAKPCGLCEDCGSQLFVRSAYAVAQFTKRYGDKWRGAPATAAAPPAEPTPAKPAEPKKETVAAAPASAPKPTASKPAAPSAEKGSWLDDI